LNQLNLARSLGDQDPRWSVVQRIVKSPLFSKSTRLKSLLLYITQKTLDGRLEEVTESQIGVNVFGRPSGYNPAEDNIVRSHARLLRKKLDAYFEEAGELESFIVTIPKGAYVPSFEQRLTVPQPQEQIAEESKTRFGEPLADRSKRAPWLLAFATAVVLALSAIAIFAFLKPREARRASRSDHAMSHLLWSHIFQSSRNTVLVPADGGLVMFENFARRPVHLPEYLSHQYVFDPLPASSIDPSLVRKLGSRRYTSLVDLDLVAALVRLPEVFPSRLRIRYARDLSMEDFKESNVILSGSIESNPWLELLEDRLLYKIENDQTRSIFTITDACPELGHRAAYSYRPGRNDEPAYAVVAFLSGRHSSANALVIEGTTVAGTEGAADFVLNESAIGPIVHHATLADGSMSDFQVLLEARNVAGSAPAVSVVSTHYGEGACNTNVTQTKFSKYR
jgi:hypothetical protein